MKKGYGKKKCRDCGKGFEFKEGMITAGWECIPFDPPRCPMCQLAYDMKQAEIRARTPPPPPKHNPYYHPEKCGLEIIGTLDEPDLDYEYNTLVFWVRTSTKEVLWASDCGCSCPTPFDDFPNGEGLGTVGSWKDAMHAINGWVEGIRGKKPSLKERQELLDKLKGYLK